MKKIYTFIVFATLMNVAVAQNNGLTCVSAIQINTNPTCQYSSHIATDTVMYFWFKATSEYINLQIKTEKYGLNIPHIHRAELCSGICGNLVVISEDELAFFSSADKLTIDLDASQLIIGNIYYIKLYREATGDVKCDKIDCFPVISPAAFDICIEEIDVFIPVDLQTESAAISHTYYQNRGQLLNTDGIPASDVKMYTFSADPAVYVGEGFVSFVKTHIDNLASTIDMHRVDMTLVGMEIIPKVFKTEQVDWTVNHYLPHIPRGVTGTKGFSRAVSNDAYPNIDVQYYSNNEGVKIYYIVRPGGDADQIIMGFKGATGTSITPTQFGDGLLIETPIGDMVFEKAHVYRVHPTNQNVTVPMPASGDFMDLGNNEYKFDIGNYPGNWTLVIGMDMGHSINTATEPEYSSYLGGSAGDFAYDIDRDALSNVYITGETQSLNFPATVGAFQDSLVGFSIDAFIMMLHKGYDANWITYYGGMLYDRGYAISFSESDASLYVTGVAESAGIDTIAFGSAYMQTWGYANCSFITLLDTIDGVPKWFSYFGGNNSFINSIETDANGNIYIVGVTETLQPVPVACTPPSGAIPRFPVCNPGAAYYQDFHAGGTKDGFIAKFDNNGVLVWSSFFGGVGEDVIKDIALDEANGDIYIGGYTNSEVSNVSFCGVPGDGSFPLCDNVTGLFRPFLNGLITEPDPTAMDGFLAKFTLNDGILVWATYYGSDSTDAITSIAVNSLGELYAAGYTEKKTYESQMDCSPASGSGFPDCDSLGNSYIQLFGLGNQIKKYDNFIVKFFPWGYYTWSTFLGGADDEGFGHLYAFTEANGSGNPSIAIDANDNVFILGTTKSSNFPIANSFGLYNQSNNNGSDDAYVLGFDRNNKQFYGSYFGGNNSDVGTNLAIVGNQRLYIIGGTKSTANFPLNDPGFPAYFQGATTVTTTIPDAFVAQINISSVPLTVETINETGGDMIIYPNPTTGEIMIEFGLEKAEEINLKIYNAMGRMVMKRTFIGQGNKKVDISGFANGIYLIQIAGGRKILNQKIIKIR